MNIRPFREIKRKKTKKIKVGKVEVGGDALISAPAHEMLDSVIQLFFGKCTLF